LVLICVGNKSLNPLEKLKNVTNILFILFCFFKNIFIRCAMRSFNFLKVKFENSLSILIKYLYLTMQKRFIFLGKKANILFKQKLFISSKDFRRYLFNLRYHKLNPYLVFCFEKKKTQNFMLQINKTKQMSNKSTEKRSWPFVKNTYLPEPTNSWEKKKKLLIVFHNKEKNI